MRTSPRASAFTNCEPAIRTAREAGEGMRFSRSADNTLSGFATKLLHAAIITCLLCSAPFLSPAQGASDETIRVVIIFPGGPDAGEEGQRMINQFLDIVTRQGKFDKGEIQGHYYNDVDQAIANLEKAGSGFIMGSMGFFLSQRKQLNLAPVALVEPLQRGDGCHYLLVKKGAVKTLESMKGGIIAGNTLYEAPRFLSRIVFQNKVDVESHFTLKPTSRPLSAIRKVAKGTLDGVLLNENQYLSLKPLAIADQLQVIYRSPPLPPLGFMMIDTAEMQQKRERMLKAVIAMCDSKEGKEACENFGIRNFKAVKKEDLSKVIKMYE